MPARADSLPSTSKTPPSLLASLAVLFDRPTRRKVALALLGTALTALAESLAVLLVAPLLQVVTGAPLDQGVLGELSAVLGHPDRGTLTLILVSVMVGAFILKDVATMGFRWWMLGFMYRQQINTAARLMDHYLRAPYELHLKRSPAEFMKTLGASLGVVYNSVVLGLMSAATDSLTIIAILIALVIAMPIPTAVMAVYFGLAALIFVRAMRPRVVRAQAEVLQASAESYRASFHAFEGVKEIKLRRAYRAFVREFHRANVKAATAGRTSTYIREIPKYVLEILFMVGVGLAVVIMSTMGNSAELLGGVGLIVAASFRILPSITRVTAAVTGIRAGYSALAEVTSEIKGTDTWSSDGDPSPRRLPFERELRVEDLGFRYAPDAPEVLHRATLRVPAGTSLALVGGSGAGKTTLVDLVLGLHTPTSGRITADGVDIADDPEAWQENVAMVPQDVYLLDATLRQNIAFTLDDALIDDDRVTEVVEKAQLTAMVAELPAGLETGFGARGVRLSGGQRQRIGIARALYRQPRLLVLDEATSALDNETEHRITRTIESLRGEMTIIIVAHRLSTVRKADALAYMRGGVIESVGTFDDVARANASFAHLVELGRLDIEPDQNPGPSNPG
ncbi:MAG: ABC transporter ATP-binding protein [Propioniciclava sp.]